MSDKEFVVLKFINAKTNETDHTAMVPKENIPELEAHVKSFPAHKISASFVVKSPFPAEVGDALKSSINGWRDPGTELENARPAPEPQEPPKEEPKPQEPPKEEAPKEEAPVEEPKPEEKPAEEPKKE